MLFSNISMIGIDFTCITSVSENNKPIRLLSNGFKFLNKVFYTILQPRLHTLLSEYN